jgi:hypothetical protein
MEIETRIGVVVVVAAGLLAFGRGNTKARAVSNVNRP